MSVTTVDQYVLVIAGKAGGMMRNGDDQIPLGFAELYASPGDHIGHFYQTREESRDLVVGFLKTGRDAGEKCVYLGPPDEMGPLSEALMAGGIDVASAQASGRLVLHEGANDPEELKDLLRGAVEDVPGKFPLLRWVGEMTWSLKKLPTTEKLMEWESHCNCVGDPKPVFLCQYDLTAFQGNVVMDALRTHSVCIVANVIHQNPYYEDPEVFLEELRRRDSTALAP